MSFSQQLAIIWLVLVFILVIIYLFIKIRFVLNLMPGIVPAFCLYHNNRDYHQFVPQFRRPYHWQQVCHFCHETQNVLFSQRNSFNCIHCLQYNGFSEDGNYNKAITGQSCDPMSQNNLRFCRPIPDCYANCGQLCGECNVNQEIKIKLLSEFMPFNETKYKEELEEYKRHLESEYKLCANCETTVKNILLKPINCLKDFVKDITKRHVRVSQDSVDSVFVSQNDRRLKKWLPFIATTVLSVLCLSFGLILSVFAINEFQDKTEISIIEFPAKLNQFLYFYLSNQTLVIFCGLMSSLTSVVISEGKSIFRFVVLFLWTLLVLSESPKIIDNYDKVLFRVLITTLHVVLFSVNGLCLLFVFAYKQFKQIITYKKQSFEKAINNGLKGVPNKVQVKNPKEVNIKSKDTRADHQSIGEQIKSLSIGDEINASSLKVNAIQRHPMRNELLPKADDLSANSALIYGNSLSKNIINPAKFHYESIAQTSWVSPFKPNQSPSKSPRKECLNYSPYLHNSQQYLRSSHWINNDMSGLVTPPPSVAPSDTSDFAFANRFSLLNKTNCSSTHVLDYKSRDFNASNESILRNTIISQQFIRRESIGRSSKDTDSDLSQVSGSLSSLSINKTQNRRQKPEYKRQKSSSFINNLTQMLIFAVFVLILFCFVIMLSLPLVFRTSFDLNSMNFQLSIESVPQNDVCIK